MALIDRKTNPGEIKRTLGGPSDFPLFDAARLLHPSGTGYSRLEFIR